jgi:hypothetical protein
VAGLRPRSGRRRDRDEAGAVRASRLERPRGHPRDDRGAGRDCSRGRSARDGRDGRDDRTRCAASARLDRAAQNRARDRACSPTVPWDRRVRSTPRYRPGRHAARRRRHEVRAVPSHAASNASRPGDARRSCGPPWAGSCAHARAPPRACASLRALRAEPASRTADAPWLRGDPDPGGAGRVPAVRRARQAASVRGPATPAARAGDGSASSEGGAHQFAQRFSIRATLGAGRGFFHDATEILG